MTILRQFTLLALLCWLCSCEVSDLSLEPELAEDEVETTTSTSSNLTAEYQLLLNQVNELRASGCRCGAETMLPVGPVRWNDRLGAAALRHSRDMANNNHFSHTGTDGSDAGQRISAAGYVWRTYGENIAAGYPTAQAVFTGWKNSPGHCRNIMNVSFLEMGVAKVDRYWSQEFATRRD